MNLRCRCNQSWSRHARQGSQIGSLDDIAEPDIALSFPALQLHLLQRSVVGRAGVDTDTRQQRRNFDIPQITREMVVVVQGLVIGLMGSAATFGPLIADISHWFNRRRGIAVAICASGNYLAGTLWPLLMNWSMPRLR